MNAPLDIISSDRELPAGAALGRRARGLGPALAAIAIAALSAGCGGANNSSTADGASAAGGGASNVGGLAAVVGTWRDPDAPAIQVKVEPDGTFTMTGLPKDSGSPDTVCRGTVKASSVNQGGFTFPMECLASGGVGSSSMRAEFEAVPAGEGQLTTSGDIFHLDLTTKGRLVRT